MTNPDPTPPAGTEPGRPRGNPAAARAALALRLQAGAYLPRAFKVLSDDLLRRKAPPAAVRRFLAMLRRAVEGGRAFAAECDRAAAPQAALEAEPARLEGVHRPRGAA